MARNPLQEVAIVGAYNTPQAKLLPDWTEPALLLDAIRGGLADAGLTPADVDGVNTSSWVWRLSPREGAYMLGARPCWTGAEAGIAGVLEAAAAIATGQAHTVVLAMAQCGEYTERERNSLKYDERSVN